MNQPMIYLDLDGVLNTWMCDEVSRRTGQLITIADWPEDLGWDIVSVVARLGGKDFRQNKLDFWRTVPESSWADCDKSAEFSMIINASAMIVGKRNVRICTTLPSDNNPAASSGKSLWCEKHLPHWLQGQVITMQHGVSKGELAKPNRLLVDDGDHNYVAWAEAGGRCILLPRPWNANAGLDTEQYFIDHVEAFQQNVGWRATA